MSPQATQPGASELDANIDALFNQLEPGAAGGTSGAASAAGETPVTRETALDPVMNTPVQAPIESPMPAADDMSALAGAEATAGNPEQPDTMLAEVSQEIEREAPRAMPAPVNAAPAIPAPSDEEMDLESAFEAPKPEELQVEPVAPVNRTAAAPSPVNIEKLDAALAENADKALAAAQDDLRKEAAAPPVVAPVVAPAPAPAKAPVPAPAPVKAAEPEEVIPELPDDPRAAAAAHAPAAAEVVEPKTPLAERLLSPLRPLAAIHERLGESTRQTIAYSAILTLFAAACAWTLPRFARGGELQPATGETPFITGYHDTLPAHGVKAPPKAHAEEKKAGGHGEEAGGHGEAAKKDSHAKAPKKKEASGGKAEEGGHAAEKPKKAPKSSKKGKAEEHGGGH